ncbi:MAG TPA: hypothetical protein VGO62_17430, partial [Myxococcota bacterium]
RGVVPAAATMGVMAQDQATADSRELAEARAAHASLLKQIAQRMRQLDELWRTARAADRLLAVQRLLQTGALSQMHATELEEKNERVRELMGRARTDKKRIEQQEKSGAPQHDVKHQLFRLELDAQRAEQERDELIDERDLRGPLYFCGETFVRSDPFGAGELPLKDMAAKVQHLEQRIAELVKLERKGVRFTTTTPDGREQTLIRMLPALTQEGEPQIDDVSDDELPPVGPDAFLEEKTHGD